MSGLVSVAMATYNGEKFLEEQVKSILGQTYPDLELVVVDDASTDGTYDLIQKLAAADKRVKPYRNEGRLGLVLNFMKAVSLCNGKFAAYSDQDDVWEANKIETLLGLLEADKQNFLAYSDLEIYAENLSLPRGSFWSQSKIAPFSGNLGERALLKNISPGCSMLFRREVMDAIAACYKNSSFVKHNKAAALDDTPFMHDHLAQVIAAGLGAMVYSRSKLVRYRQHSANSIGAFYQARASRVDFLHKLSARIQAMEPYRGKLTGINWEKLDEFVSEYRRSDRDPMPAFIPFFDFLRNNTIKDRLLGRVDCLFPSIYKKAVNYVKAR